MTSLLLFSYFVSFTYGRVVCFLNCGGGDTRTSNAKLLKFPKYNFLGNFSYLKKSVIYNELCYFCFGGFEVTPSDGQVLLLTATMSLLEMLMRSLGQLHAK